MPRTLTDSRGNDGCRQRALIQLKRRASTATKTNFKDFAERPLPTIESELQQARQLSARVSRQG